MYFLGQRLKMMSVLYLMCTHTLKHTEAGEYSEQVKRRAHLLLGNPRLLAHWLTSGLGETHTLTGITEVAHFAHCMLLVGPRPLL